MLHLYKIIFMQYNLRKIRKVAQYNSNSNLIAVYNGIGEASRTVGGPKDGISKLCFGKQYTSVNFIWRYID